MNKTSSELALLEVNNYREFIIKILCNGQESIPRGALAKLARKAEFSRSFLSEVLSGKKKLTLSSFKKISSALKLSNDLIQFFGFLVAEESEDFCRIYFNLSQEKVTLKKQYLLKRISQKNLFIEQSQNAKTSELLSYDIFCVYAALGTVSIGSDFSEIIKKTNLDPVRIQRSLEKMLELNWVKKINQTYFATERTLDFQQAGNDLGFLKAISESTTEISKNINKISENKDNLLFFSALPIHKDRIQEFNSRLRTCLLEIMDEFQDDNGQIIKKINLSSY